jgi:hypothetical protein
VSQCPEGRATGAANGGLLKKQLLIHSKVCMLGSIKVRFPSLVTILLLLRVSFERIELDDVTGTLPVEMKDPVAHIDIGTDLFWNS